jgi:hypothetical protein
MYKKQATKKTDDYQLQQRCCGTRVPRLGKKANITSTKAQARFNH